MGIWNKPHSPEPDGGHTDRLREIAGEKVEAAERFSSAIAAAGEAMTALFDADRAFLAEYRHQPEHRVAWRWKHFSPGRRRDRPIHAQRFQGKRQ